MRFFAYLNPQTRGPQDDERIIDFITQEALELDAAGFPAICLTEHHFTNYNTYGNSFMYGAYLAPQLKQAYIILTVAVPPIHNPIRFAEQCNLLDMLTKGKAVIGVAPGASPIEFEGFGRNASQRYVLLEQALDIAMKAWQHTSDDPPLTYETPFERGTLRLRITPSPYRKPHPLLGRATLTDATYVQTGQRGWPLFFGRFAPKETGEKWRLYYDALQSSGHAPETIQTCLTWSGVQKMIYVAETDEQALADIEGPLNYFQSIGRQSFAADSFDVNPEAKVVSAGPRDAFLAQGTIIGSPDTVAARIQEFADVGIPNLMLLFTWGDMDFEKVLQSRHLFLERVMPRFTAAVAPR